MKDWQIITITIILIIVIFNVCILVYKKNKV